MPRPSNAAYRLSRYRFGDSRLAGELLGPAGLGLWNDAAGAPADQAAGSILDALAQSADPDLALLQLHRLVEAQRRRPQPPGDPLPATGVLAAARADPALRGRLVALLGVSATLGDYLVANPGEWVALAGAGVPRDAVVPDGATVPDGAAPLGPVTDVPGLRRAYRRELVRIVGADLTGALDVVQVMARLAELADATLAAALAIAAAERPHEAAACRLAVIAMGKCGGRELNYVSDVDVVFVCEPAGSSGAAAGANPVDANPVDASPAGASPADASPVDAESALRAGAWLATRMMHICGLVAWPVDAALRPEGASGPLVRTLASHLAYYRTWAKTWEFQALLKARPAAGDMELGAEWFSALQPLVWHAAERPAAVDEVRRMRRRIVGAVPRGEVDREIKRGPGGLRDIEFAVQLLQLVHGRADETLRSPSTLEALRALIDGGYVGRVDGEGFARSYRFLRTVEHRLQLQRLRRTHTVPVEEGALRWLAHALGFHGDSAASATDRFRAAWVRHASEVRRLHAKLLYRPLLDAVARVPSQDLRLTPEAAGARLVLLGYADPAGALRHIEALTSGVSRTAAIQRTLLPVLLGEFADVPEPDRGLLAYRRVSETLGAAPWYLRLLRDEGPVALRLARVLGLSQYLADLLSRDPEALRLLADAAESIPRPAEALHEGFEAAAARHAPHTGEPVAPEAVRASAAASTVRAGVPASTVRATGEAIAAIRALRRRELFRIAGADLLGELDVSSVGSALADIADATLAAALSVANRTGPRLTIIGMGSLGGREMSYPSDADVLFVYEPVPGMAEDVANREACAVAEELRRLLALPSPDPPLGIDADLRPEGRQGPLVRSLAAYQQYYARWSKLWEAQALLRARFVAGDPEVGRRFAELADPVRYPAGGLSPAQITEIRRIKARVDSERLPRGADPATHTKLGPGGLADVEWTVQLLQLRYGHEVAGLRTVGTLDALRAATEAGLVVASDASALVAGWELVSRVRNALTLVRGRPTDQLPRRGSDLAGVVQVLGHRAGADPGEFLDVYLRTTRRARQVVERVFSTG